MKEKFKCKFVDEDNSELIEIEAWDEEDAVEEFLKRVYEEGEGYSWMSKDYGKTSVICIDKNEEEKSFTWEVEFPPTFLIYSQEFLN